MAKTQRGPAGDQTPLEICSRQNNSSITEIATLRQEPNTLPDLWTYIGQEPIGRMYSGPDGVGAFSGAGDYIGTFTTAATARSAIWDHHKAVVDEVDHAVDLAEQRLAA